MRDPPRELDLAQESLHRARVRGDGWPDGLERNAIAENEVVGLVDLAHSSLGDEADDAEPPGEDLAGGKRARRAGRAAARRSAGRRRDGHRILVVDPPRVAGLIHHPLRRWNSFRKETRACTPASGKAL
jgi:hypothetical protein